MSMLSSKCDGLRNAADELQNVIYNYRCQGFVGILHYAVHGLRDAADTIWELRNKLAGVVDQSEEIKRLEDENAKLRELVLKNWCIALSEREALRTHDIDPDGGTYMAALDNEIATAKDHMRELGIEVTGK